MVQQNDTLSADLKAEYEAMSHQLQSKSSELSTLHN